jgi:cellulose synthase/poly-beta-1,6-N-acetylglucosamine synthase-like glycosyltransferase
MFWAPLASVGVLTAAVGWFGLATVLDAAAAVIGVLFLVFFLRHLLFAAVALQRVPAELAAPLREPAVWPSVSILVACHNEQAVVERLVGALGSLDYPSALVELVLVDDGSTDRTGVILDQLAPTAGLRCIHRPVGSEGGKSAALNAGLESCSGEVVVVFDADHSPRPDALKRLVRHFEDPTVAAVQGRCQIANPQDAPLTRLVAIDYLAGYLVNEYGRQALFGLPAYGGANCAIRARHLRALGGWNSRSVTEDTDLTLRLLLAGHRLRYDVTAVDEEEGVIALGRYWKQRYRWARGHQQVWRDYRREVWASPWLTVAQKIETTMFLFAFHLPAVSGFGIGILVAWAIGVTPPVDPLSLYVFSVLMFLGPLVELSSGLLLGRADRSDARALVFFLPLFYISIALCTKAWIDGMAGRDYAWVKTKRSADRLVEVTGR